jgi:preprotein translocase SecE subunit
VRAGSVLAAVLVFLAAWIAIAIGNAMDKEGQEGVGLFMKLVVAGLFLVALLFTFTRTAFGNWLGGLEDSGWFTNHGFKPNQGVRVRRATVLGLLVIGLTGVYSMSLHHMFGTTRAVDNPTNMWYWWVPFTQQKLFVPLLPHVHVWGPILMSAAIFWISWRLVNWPVFADFLIATEAEMNKVSWTTRKRLVTDTIVVLVSVFIITWFLFLVDLVWFSVLSSPYINVLHVDLRKEQAKQQEKTQW